MIRRIRNSNITKLDIGCKKSTKKGFAGIDINDYGQDIVWDVTQGLPFKDNSIDEVFMGDFIEHLKVEDLQPFLIDLYRILKKGAKIEIRVPHCEYIESYYANHLTFWNEDRIKGIVDGFKNAYPLEIKMMVKSGIHLNIVLKKC